MNPSWMTLVSLTRTLALALRLVAPANTRDGGGHERVAVHRPRVAEVVVQRGGALHLQQQRGWGWG